MQWINSVLAKGEHVNFFHDEYRCPVYVKDLVTVILQMANKWISGFICCNLYVSPPLSYYFVKRSIIILFGRWWEETTNFERWRARQTIPRWNGWSCCQTYGLQQLVNQTSIRIISKCFVTIPKTLNYAGVFFWRCNLRFPRLIVVLNRLQTYQWI